MTLPTDPPDADSTPDAWLSDLADGRLDPAELPRRCAQWAGDPQCRRTWHAYQLIGDVLRSDDLAQGAARDAAFLGRLRERLTLEPVVLAPAARRRSHRKVWALPLAAAAGFVAVAGVAVVLQQADAGDAGPRVAVVEPVARPVPPTLTGEQVQILRDARIDEYLQLHRQTLAGAPVALPGGAMRNVDLTVPQR